MFLGSYYIVLNLSLIFRGLIWKFNSFHRENIFFYVPHNCIRFARNISVSVVELAKWNMINVNNCANMPHDTNTWSASSGHTAQAHTNSHKRSALTLSTRWPWVGSTSMAICNTTSQWCYWMFESFHKRIST
jgi:hypothetical protein